jgi:glutamate synthase (NADPH/NADH) small chain
MNPMPAQEPEVRNKNFDEVTLGYTPEMAVWTRPSAA